MTILKRAELPSFLAKTGQAEACRLYLFFGERFLCREACDQVEKALAASPATVHRLDGDTEDPGRTLASLMTYSLLPGRQIYRVTDSGLFQSGVDAEKSWNKLEEAVKTSNRAAAKRHCAALASLAGISAGEDGGFSALSEEKWRQIFSFDKPAGDLAWADRLFSETADGKKASDSGRLADMYITALEKGFAAGHYLLVTCDALDKRQRLFAYIKKQTAAVAIDCQMATSAKAADKKEREAVLREVVAGRLAELGKKIEPAALELLFARTSDAHPTAVAVEAEKLALFCGERQQISRADVELLTVRTHEDALFELTDAFSKGDLGRALGTVSHLLDGGVHALAILATLRNYFRRLLIIKALQEQGRPPWRPDLDARRFQDSYLPALKDTGRFPELLQGHPYALFNNFRAAARWSIATLRLNLAAILQAEYRMKSSALPTNIIFDEMLTRLLRQEHQQRDTPPRTR
ncbi:MAG: hypothetical protein LBU39_00615 [Desulfobulbaceae bacterium]|jgi:DNA polymerase-3 subunit delta|nr:hypothetical protein [Desulfobulbaceae bacterium]